MNKLLLPDYGYLFTVIYVGGFMLVKLTFDYAGMFVLLFSLYWAFDVK